ncbi:MAG: HTTM domain-containing protein [Bdellovibrionota bacterium]
MTLIILSGLSLASLFPENSPITSGCLWYICLQTCLSYFVSGSVKLRKANWRSGKALAAFIASSNYQLPMLIKQLFKNPFFLFISSWSVITMELCFPATLINPQVCLGLISAAFIFHIVNWYILGLNRFVFAWLAAYPAVYYCSSFLNR